ncbi:YqaA family protein [Reichenbachiella ulvae]|uniref:VTT domain-containing protein n=1 Tax=Reichenbachiella ulvae TaxID=2980104 RepID=A0ABT3CWV3_9BACT|nr:VTT domain-containing protein [Reichenbachiella ulvae]MCV9387688.1 VTT domain-containing protein [Reichenbachiella ulvae]
MKIRNSKYRYLVSNLIKGLVWLLLIVVVFWIAKSYFEDWYNQFMEEIADKPILVFSTFTLSEVLFGIIPPELFMIWSLHQGGAAHYVLYTLILSLISYAAGVIGFYFGRSFSNFKVYRKIKERMSVQLERNVRRFGGFMIFIAAVTPIPFSAICMITGAVGYKTSNFLLIGLSRLARFAIYAYVIWQVDKI